MTNVHGIERRRRRRFPATIWQAVHGEPSALAAARLSRARGSSAVTRSTRQLRSTPAAATTRRTRYDVRYDDAATRRRRRRPPTTTPAAHDSSDAAARDTAPSRPEPPLRRRRGRRRLMCRRTAAALGAGAAALVCRPRVALAWPAGSAARSPPRRAPGRRPRPGHGSSSAASSPRSSLYLGGPLAARAPRPPRLAVVAVLAAAMQLAPLGAPLLLSTDAWTYWDYGRIAAVHHANPYDDAAERVPARPGASGYVGTGWRNTTSVYGPAFTLASEPLGARGGLVRGRGGLDLQGARGAGRARVDGAGGACSPGGRPSRAPSSAGTRCWPSTSRAAATTTPGCRRSCSAALALAAPRPAASPPASRWAAAIFVKWVPLLFLPLRALEARATGRRVGHLGFAITAVVVAVARDAGATASRWLDFARAARAEREPGDAVRDPAPAGGARAPAPGRGRRAGRRCSRSRTSGSSARRARGRARLGLAAALLLLATPYLAAWYVVWARRSRPPRRTGTAQVLALALSRYLAAADRSALAVGSRRSTRLNTSTPSCSKTSFQAGLRRSQTSWAAVGIGAIRSA